MNQSSQKPNYGIDAPGVISQPHRHRHFDRYLFLNNKNWKRKYRYLRFSLDGLVPDIGRFLMLFYSLKGKYTHRDRMLS